MNDNHVEKPQQRSPDRRSESTKKWVERRDAAKSARAQDDQRVAAEAARKDHLAQQDYQNPMGVWIGLALVVGLVAAGMWVFESLKCDPLDSDLALVKKSACDK
jgi:sensor c-di-GMP phosphodiesterase-like protein